MGLKLGDNEYKERKKEESDEEMKEETIMTKIRELKKKRNRERGNLRRAEFRGRDKDPAKKRRNVDNLGEQNGEECGETTSEPEKRQLNQGGGASQETKDIGQLHLEQKRAAPVRPA